MSISHHCYFHSQKASHNTNNVGEKLWGEGQSSRALVSAEKPEAPAMGMRQKPKHNQVILHWENGLSLC